MSKLSWLVFAVLAVPQASSAWAENRGVAISVSGMTYPWDFLTKEDRDGLLGIMTGYFGVNGAALLADAYKTHQ